MTARHLIFVTALGLLGGCNSHQSSLSPFGEEARDVRAISVILLAGAIIIFLTVVGLYWRAVRAPEDGIDHRGGMRLILWMGAVIPTVILAALLLYTLPAMRPIPVSDDDLVIAVKGEQFWWRVAYHAKAQKSVISANEIRLPVGRTVLFRLTAKDVVHSFWIPGLAGKMDMIPGRATQLAVRAEKAGRYRGVCAEFCGLSHALMAFDVIAMEPHDFDAWMARASIETATPRDAAGARLFTAHGCAGCHQASHDTIGPSLSDFAERRSLGAGILPPTVANVSRFIRAPQTVKPGVRMPAYPQLSIVEAEAIARHLGARP